MAKRNLVLLFILSFAFQSSLAAERITTKNWPKFADIEWGSSKEAVKKALEKKGYECEHPKTLEGETRLFFTGMLAGEKASGTCHFTQRKLVMIQIAYPVWRIDSDAAAFGRKLTEVLKKKYGAPLNVSEGKKVKFAWVTADNPPCMPIILEINAGEIIRVNYFSLAQDRAFKKGIEQDEKSQTDF